VFSGHGSLAFQGCNSDIPKKIQDAFGTFLVLQSIFQGRLFSVAVCCNEATG